VKLVVAFIKPFKLEEVKAGLKEVGVSGMSVTEVRGFGRQAGQTEIYRGAEYQVEFLPKVRVEVAVPAALVDDAVATIERAARSGEIGDGKILVLPLEEVVRIRTGERGEGAI